MKHLVMFGGGSGSRDLTMALCRAGHRVTRIVPAWDSGGSSKALRESLGILAMGDIRQALMTMAHGEGRVGSVVRFFNARLSEAATPADLLAEFGFYAGGGHPLLGTMEPGLRGAVLNYLRVFQSRIGPDFDFRRGSIGNFVLAGAYLAHGRDINTAIFVFRKLCQIEGDVWPSTTDDGVALVATLRDGRTVAGQERITRLDPALAAAGIARVRLQRGGAAPDDHRPPAANPAVLEALACADLLVFGPGSWWTSTLPHLAVDGLAAAMAARPEVPRVLVGNLLECPETLGSSLGSMVAAMIDGAGAAGGLAPTHVIAHRGWVPFERVVNGFRYLQEGLGEAGPPPGLTWIADDFEDPWHRGRHDAPRVAALLGTLLP